MAEPTFAEQNVTPPELSESDKIRKRITEYKAQLSPNSLQVIELMLSQQLASGQIKPADLDALIILRDDINKAGIDYRTAVEHAQRRLGELAETEAAEKAAAEEAKMQAIEEKLTDERTLRKSTQDRLAQMEAVLASHGISMDLNQDGVVGLTDGQVADELTAEEQTQVDNMIQVEKNNVTTQPSRAFQMARAMNPAPTHSTDGGWDEPLVHEPSVSDEQMAAANEMISAEEEGFDANGSPTTEVATSVPQSEQTFTINPNLATNSETQTKIEEARKSFGEWDKQTQLELKLRENVPAEAMGTEEFNAEVERVSQQADSAPVISNSQLPEQTDEVLETPTEDGGPNDEFVLSRQSVKMIEDYPEEEEYEEITIPTESELKKMTKSAIAKQADILDFDIPTSLTKPKMIEKFMAEVEAYITNLQESGDFVSATTDEDGDADTDNNKDGGYF